jgi:hypothetical protein
MEVLEFANVGTGKIFKNHPTNHMPLRLRHHHKLKEKGKEMMTTLNLKKKTSFRKKRKKMIRFTKIESNFMLLRTSLLL